MASVTIITDICRLSHVHLKEPHKFQEKDALKYRIAAMFPQSGQAVIEKLGIQFPSSRDSLVTAIKQVVMEEFGFEFDPENLEYVKQCGIQFPPNFKDGNKKFAKDANGNPIPGSVDPISAGYWIVNINADATEQPGCVHGVTIAPIDPSAIYSGCWGRLQVEVSAYTTKDNARVIAVKLLNVMMCYDDESFGGAGPKQDAASAFAGMAVTNSNLSAGDGQGAFQPMTQAKPAQTPPQKPAPTPPVAMVEKLVMNAGCEYTYEYLSKECQWTDEQIIEGGYATMVKQPAAPAKPAPTPPQKPAPTPPVKAAPPVPVKPTPSVPLTGTVIMNSDSPYSYDELTKEHGWTDQDIIAANYGKPNFTNQQ